MHRMPFSKVYHRILTMKLLVIHFKSSINVTQIKAHDEKNLWIQDFSSFGCVYEKWWMIYFLEFYWLIPFWRKFTYAQISVKELHKDLKFSREYILNVIFLCANFQVNIRNSTFSHVLWGTTAIFLRLTDEKMISREKQIRILIFFNHWSQR
jgi:hypothetical protein